MEDLPIPAGCEVIQVHVHELRPTLALRIHVDEQRLRDMPVSIRHGAPAA